MSILAENSPPLVILLSLSLLFSGEFYCWNSFLPCGTGVRSLLLLRFSSRRPFHRKKTAPLVPGGGHFFCDEVAIRPDACLYFPSDQFHLVKNPYPTLFVGRSRVVLLSPGIPISDSSGRHLDTPIFCFPERQFSLTPLSHINSQRNQKLKSNRSKYSPTGRDEAWKDKGAGWKIRCGGSRIGALEVLRKTTDI